MLRQAVTGGEIVKLADFCSSTEPSAYVDECVPKGTYRYGFGKSYLCNQYACGGTPYYAEVTVTSELAESCTRSDGNTAPTSASSVPWGDDDDNDICDSSYGGGGGGIGGGGIGGGGIGGGGIGGGSDGGSGSDGSSSSAGCSVGLPAGSVPVLGANALALLAGMALMRRMRSRKP